MYLSLIFDLYVCYTYSMRILLEQVALWGSIIGAILLALHVPISGWAYIPYLISNVASIYLLRKSNAPKVITYQCIFFMFANILGIGRWLL
jgi:membrane-associated HD superfamily phosphohydrolase